MNKRVVRQMCNGYASIREKSAVTFLALVFSRAQNGFSGVIFPGARRNKEQSDEQRGSFVA